MWKKMPLTGATLVMQETLEAEGEAALGIMGAMFYSTEIDTPENKKFVKAYINEYKELPGAFSAVAYEAATVIVLALKEIEKDIQITSPTSRLSGEAFIKAVSNISFRRPKR